jgi:hypothetical protein
MMPSYFVPLMQARKPGKTSYCCEKRSIIHIIDQNRRTFAMMDAGGLTLAERRPEDEKAIHFGFNYRLYVHADGGFVSCGERKNLRGGRRFI